MPEDTPSIHQTLEQARAKAAWQLVAKAKEDLQGGFDKYEALVKRFPALVNHTGLGQVAAFLFSKREINKHGVANAEGQLLEHLAQWLMKSPLQTGVSCYAPPYADPYATSTKESAPLVTCITKHDSRAYRHATREALAFLEYLRRFAAGMNVKKGNEAAMAGEKPSKED